MLGKQTHVVTNRKSQQQCSTHHTRKLTFHMKFDILFPHLDKEIFTMSLFCLLNYEPKEYVFSFRIVSCSYRNFYIPLCDRIMFYL
jgi:hypothetical protein